MSRTDKDVPWKVLETEFWERKRKTDTNYRKGKRIAKRRGSKARRRGIENWNALNTIRADLLWW